MGLSLAAVVSLKHFLFLKGFYLIDGFFGSILRMLFFEGVGLGLLINVG